MQPLPHAHPTPCAGNPPTTTRRLVSTPLPTATSDYAAATRQGSRKRRATEADIDSTTSREVRRPHQRRKMDHEDTPPPPRKRLAREKGRSDDDEDRDIQDKDLKSEDVKQEDLKSEDFKAEDVKQEDAKHEDVTHEDAKHEDVTHEGVRREDTKDQDIKNEDVKDEDGKDKHAKDRRVKDEGVKNEPVKKHIKSEHVEKHAKDKHTTDGHAKTERVNNEYLEGGVGIGAHDMHQLGPEHQKILRKAKNLADELMAMAATSYEEFDFPMPTFELMQLRISYHCYKKEALRAQKVRDAQWKAYKLARKMKASSSANGHTLKSEEEAFAAIEHAAHLQGYEVERLVDEVKKSEKEMIIVYLQIASEYM
ncbi:hypothetical protein M409DRAFT_29487 [Zasmidium cellare ATCC 36951]|uniref:Uncharacterized protein n=1 Tax=Zasmidium cellare ATCC 36951 TaxID=1080233 RepID=A0A6A6BZ94_ZASCE|nr:uncharacterized protein M409DRAFT_29487 [Zasmidium cellare ATCC 36951]KAF2160035.1 hypothetical protein M409DRAFT_29487 [Zasmidium cellare ATCC 36951]